MTGALGRMNKTRQSHQQCSHQNGTISREIVGRTTYLFEDGTVNYEAVDTHVVARDGYVRFICSDCGFDQHYRPSTYRSKIVQSVEDQAALRGDGNGRSW